MYLEKKEIAELLKTCDREPIHIPGTIQPHGFLLGADNQSFSVKYASENWANLLELPLSEILGMPLAEIFGRYLLLRLQELMQTPAEDYQRPTLVYEWEFKQQKYHLLFHRVRDLIILELEPQSQAETKASFQWLDRYQNRIRSISLQEMYQEVVKEIRRMTGYDRVMIYKFHPDQHGEVVAEDKRSDLEAYLGLHYPASDIPKQARALYLTNLTRLLVQVDYEPVKVVSKANDPLDMSQCGLRGVSPLHLQYLRNMGVGATLTISILHNEKLWGLIACHHEQPKQVDFHTRSTCELVSRLLSLHLPGKEEEEIRKKTDANKYLVDQLIDKIKQTNSFVEGLMGGNELFLLYEEVVGVALLYQNTFKEMGIVPASEKIQEFIRWSNDNHPVHQGLYTSYQLDNDYPLYKDFPSEIKGVLLLKVHDQMPFYLLWFRGEYQKKIYWGGNPEKAVTVNKKGAELTPRNSFSKYLQTISGQAQVWEDYELTLAVLLGQRLRDEVIDLQHGLLQDTTALFQLTYEQSSDALFIANHRDISIVDCNDTAVKLFEAINKSELIGTVGLDLIVGGKEAREKYTQLIKNQLASHGEISQDLHCKTLRGNKFWGRFSAKMLKGVLQKLYIVRVVDISQSKAYENQLREQNRALKKANQELDRFVYSASHDLRAPISSLMGLIQVAQDIDDIEEILKYLDLGKQSLARLDHFIQEILDYSRNARMEIRREEVLLNVIIQDVLDNYAYVEEYRGIRKEVKIKQEVPVYTDPFRLKVILNNLISNALRYSFPDKRNPYVRVQAYATPEQLEVTVEDNGQGIPKNHTAHIFNMFYRADSRKSGSGLGLYIVKETVEKLGGDIELHSEFEKGTTFRLRIPNAVSETVPVSEPEKKSQ
jgi:light-regulated signal transduction histidine kinase (bacteriophytochrome)